MDLNQDWATISNDNKHKYTQTYNIQTSAQAKLASGF